VQYSLFFTLSIQFIQSQIWHQARQSQSIFTTLQHSCAIYIARAVFTHGPKGPGPRAANFQGRHIKNIKIEVWYAGKKRLSTREKFKGDLYWKHYVLSFVSFLCWFCLHITEYEQIGGGGGAQNFGGPRGLKYLNTGLLTSEQCWYYYLAGSTMCLHLPAPISQLCNLPHPIVSLGSIFFLLITGYNRPTLCTDYHSFIYYSGTYMFRHSYVIFRELPVSFWVTCKAGMVML
jgi:hypothetical protein